jgi:hypothetical protein
MAKPPTIANAIAAGMAERIDEWLRGEFGAELTRAERDELAAIETFAEFDDWARRVGDRLHGSPQFIQ